MGALGDWGWVSEGSVGFLSGLVSVFSFFHHSRAVAVAGAVFVPSYTPLVGLLFF